MKIQFYNTLTGKKEDFEPIKKGEATIYSCGPTVYDYAHIGNFRSFLMSDLLFRVLKNLAGLKVKKVQNITDVGHLTGDDLADATGEDKISKKAREANKDPFVIARYFEEKFIEDEEALRIIPPNGGRPRATEFIPQQIEIAKELIAKGFAYQKNGSVYFRTEKFPNYGILSKNKLKDLQAGARVEINTEKENPLDFALWKRANENHLMQWNFETGKKIDVADIPEFHKTNPDQAGFPGWHIECSAMSRDLLGEKFDIHTGGEDNIFPHHECEIAQNASVSGDPEVQKNGGVNVWIHAKFLLVEGEKMSKSKGNFFTIRDLLAKGFSGTEIRFALMKSHYRTAMNFSEKGLQEARTNIKKIREAHKFFLENAGELVEEVKFNIEKNEYKKALFDDLNVPQALFEVYQMIDLETKGVGYDVLPESAARMVDFLENDFDLIFDILTPEAAVELSEEVKAEIEKKIEERNEARAEKDFAKSDAIRDELAEKFDIELIDEDGKTSWRVRD